MAKIKFELTFDTDNGSFSVVNTETGEIQEVAIPKVKKATSTKKVKDDGDPTPKITLDENKYTLNKAAADLLLTDSDENRLEIKYEKNGKLLLPVIGNCIAFGTKGGNKVTKSLTVACRGKANQELAKYGSVFTLEAHPSKEGQYYLKGDTMPEETELDGDENISLPEEDTIVTNDDLNLDGLLTEDNGNDTEVDAFDFTL